MSRYLVAAAVAASMSIVVTVPAFAGDYAQLARAAGIRGEVPASLDEIAAIKFSRDGQETRQAYIERASVESGESAATVRSSRTGGRSLDEVHLRMVNDGVSGDQRQAVLRRDGIQSNPLARRRLAASAGISPADADALTLATIAGQKFSREADLND